MLNYVAGFLFDEPLENVILIRKNRPKWQAGKLNGVGGKVEAMETNIAAMNREFKEEAGIYVYDHLTRNGCAQVSKDHLWRPVVRTVNTMKQWHVTFLRAICTKAYEKAHTVTDEEIVKVPVNEIHKHDTISELQWLIPMCRDLSHIVTPIEIQVI